LTNNCYIRFTGGITYYSPYTYLAASTCNSTSYARYAYLNDILPVDNYLNTPTITNSLRVEYGAYLTTDPISTLRVWIDKNQNNKFEITEKVNLSNVQKTINSGSGSKYISGNLAYSDLPVSDGYYKTRLIVADNAGSGNACDTLSNAAAIDLYIHVITYNGSNNPINIFSNVSQTSVKALNRMEVISSKIGNFNSGNTFNIELSDSTGVFSNPTLLQSGLTNLGTNYPTIPSTTLTSNHYRIRIVSTNPVSYSLPSAEFRIYNPCPNNVNIITPITQTQNFNTSNSITANTSVNSNKSVEFTAGNVINLLPGFIVIPNTQNQFKASILGCPN
jgi:hypothetical protein